MKLLLTITVLNFLFSLYFRHAYGLWLYSVNFVIYVIFLGMLTYLVALPHSYHTSVGNSTNSSNSSYLLRSSNQQVSVQLI